MFRRLLLVLCTAMIAAVLSVLPASPAAADGPVLTVPAGPLSGDVTVTVQADPAAYPFVQVVLGLPGDVGPGRYTYAIDPAPVQTAEAPQEIVVPSWGLTDVDATFVLVGCQSGEGTSCTTPLADVDRRMVQTRPVTGSIELPSSEPVFVPEEKVLVYVDNEGGGRILASNRGTPGQEIPNRIRTEFTGYGRGFTHGPVNLQLRRCSTLTTSHLYCEPFQARSFHAVRDLYVLWKQKYDYPLVWTLNPAWGASRREYEIDMFHMRGLGLTLDFSWELRNSSGARVVGPVDVLTGADPELNYAHTVSLGAEATEGLADGTYQLVRNFTAHKPGMSKTTTLTRDVEIAANPPREPATPVPTVLSRVVRADPDGGTPSLYARFRVPSLGTYVGTPAYVQLRNSAGRLVDRGAGVVPCDHGYGRSCGGVTRPEFHLTVEPYGSDNVRLPAGVYQAEAFLPDRYGRHVAVGLGPVYVQHGTIVTRTARWKARRPMIRVKRTLTLDQPWSGNDINVHSSRVWIKVGKTDGAGPVGRVRCWMPVQRAAVSRRIPRSPGWHDVCGAYGFVSGQGFRDHARVRFRVRKGARVEIKRVRAAFDIGTWTTAP